MLKIGIVAAVSLCSWQSGAHDAVPTADQPLGWQYPWNCCALHDCRAALDGEITEGPDGYVVTATGEIVAYRDKRVKDSPDGDMHLCAHQAGIDAGHTICLFVPPKGF